MTDHAAVVLEALDWFDDIGAGSDAGHALVAVWRDGKWVDEHSDHCKPCRARAALAALEQELANASYFAVERKKLTGKLIPRLREAEARVKELEAEIEDSGKYVLLHRQKRRAEAAEAENDAIIEAVWRELPAHGGTCPRHDPPTAKTPCLRCRVLVALNDARAALEREDAP